MAATVGSVTRGRSEGDLGTKPAPRGGGMGGPAEPPERAQAVEATRSEREEHPPTTSFGERFQ